MVMDMVVSAAGSQLETFLALTFGLAAFTKLYLGYTFQPKPGPPSRQETTGLRVEGTVCWTLSQRVGTSEAEVSRFLAGWDEKGYKMGLLVKTGQRVERLAYAREGGGELALRPDAGVKAELERVLGTPAGGEWVGLVSSPGRRKYTHAPEEPHIVCFEVTLTIAPAEEGPQPIPVVSRHLAGSFADSYMPGLWVIPGLARGARR